MTIDGMIIELIKNLLTKEGHTYPPTLGNYRMSQLPWCLRKIYLDITDPTIEETPELGANTTGEAIHQLIASSLKGSNQLIASEQEVTLTQTYIKEEQLIFYNLTGHYDLLMLSNKGLIVVDIKTIKNLYYVRNQAKEEHLNQLALYQKALGMIPGLIIYIERESFEMVGHYSEFDPGRLFTMALKGQDLHDALKEGHNLVEPKEKPDWECDYCKHFKAKKCFQNL